MTSLELYRFIAGDVIGTYPIILQVTSLGYCRWRQENIIHCRWRHWDFVHCSWRHLGLCRCRWCYWELVRCWWHHWDFVHRSDVTGTLRIVGHVTGALCRWRLWVIADDVSWTLCVHCRWHQDPRSVCPNLHSRPDPLWRDADTWPLLQAGWISRFHDQGFGGKAVSMRPERYNRYFVLFQHPNFYNA